ncbi:M20 metallopeptidase family protein [Paenibacillus cymbidii]|uniref:M20 metallopeptidase family protein n=1 Tax=Paenibacillus cymbidii TaxID=1639034 RepID=UPI001F3FAB96|nr:amidohydrolase [Paenibacillus cymbidii]
MFTPEAEKARLAPQLVAFRRELHRQPELSLCEERTAAAIVREIAPLGLTIRSGVGGHGVIADLAGAFPGPTVALRADIDALPIVENTGLPFTSQHDGVMHACGHDAHTTVLLGALKLLAAAKDRLHGNVRFLFQPAEEILAGAAPMIAAGALDGVSEIYGLHILPSLPAGRIASTPGTFMAAIDRLDIVVEGRGGHGSMPEQCIDPIVAAAAVVTGLQTAVSREVHPLEPAVVSLGTINGGTANNIIPDRVALSGTVRTLSEEVRAAMPERIERLTRLIAEAHRCRVTVAYQRQVPPVVNNAACEAKLRRTAERTIGGERIVSCKPSMGGEDFALYAERIPGCFFWLGSGGPDAGSHSPGLHNAQMVVDESCLMVGVTLFTELALGLLDGSGESQDA